jgi:hypothetical protein
VHYYQFIPHFSRATPITFYFNIVTNLTQCNVGFLVFTVRKYKNMFLPLKTNGRSIIRTMSTAQLKVQSRDYILISIKAAARLSARVPYIPLKSKQKPVACSSEQADGHLKFVKCQQSNDQPSHNKTLKEGYDRRNYV